MPGVRFRILSADALTRLARTFGMNYVGQPFIPDEPGEFLGTKVIFNLVLRKIEDPETVLAKLYEARVVDGERFEELDEIAASGAPALICDVLGAAHPAMVDPSIRDLYARSSIRAGRARGQKSRAFFEGGAALPDLTLGLYWHDRGDYAKALSYYERLDASDTEKPFLSGMCHLHREDWHRARKAFAAARKDAEADLRLWVGLIAAYGKLDDRPAVLRTVRALIAHLEHQHAAGDAWCR
jgi:tetratricopeptide (TPR) repeat protein